MRQFHFVIYSIYLARELLDGDILLMDGFENTVLDVMLDSKENCMMVSTAQPLPEKDFKAVLRGGQIVKVGVAYFQDAAAVQPLYFRVLLREDRGGQAGPEDAGLYDLCPDRETNPGARDGGCVGAGQILRPDRSGCWWRLSAPWGQEPTWAGPPPRPRRTKWPSWPRWRDDHAVDLHTHTVVSDGQHTPAELVKLAKERRLGVLAVTDHDTIAEVNETQCAGDALSLRVVRGVELSAREHSNFHILGYGFRDVDTELARLCEKFRAGRDERKYKIVNFLREKGVEVDLAEGEALAGSEVIARPHFAQVMVKHGYASSDREAFDR